MVCLLIGLAVRPLALGALLPHSPLVPTAEELAPLARVRALLATSNPTNRNPVRIIFYGQSITLGPWWQQVANELRRLYPDADLQIENLAIAGFQDWPLARTVQADLIPRQPDLVIFHAYGTGAGTDNLLRQLRSGTTAEILVQTDHPHENQALDEETNPQRLTPENANPYRNYVALPAIARRHGAALARVRDAWKAYCRSNSVLPTSLLVDHLHSTADGHELMAEFVLAYLQPGLELPAVNPWECPRVRSFKIGRDVCWQGQILECDFTGSSLFAELTGAFAGEVEVWIDGKRAADHSELLGFNRVSPTHFAGWPTLALVEHSHPLLEEEWTFTPNNFTPDQKYYTFSVVGSRTGPDGVGNNAVRFVSNSGRVIIEPWDHWIFLSVLLSLGEPLPAGFTARWQVERHFLDPIPAGWTPPAHGLRSVRLAQGLSDAPHRLRLVMTTGSPAPLAVLRAHSPAGLASITASLPQLAFSDDRLHVVKLPGGPAVAWTSNARGLQLESSIGLLGQAPWVPVPAERIESRANCRFYSLAELAEPTFFRLIQKEDAPARPTESDLQP